MYDLQTRNSCEGCPQLSCGSLISIIRTGDQADKAVITGWMHLNASAFTPDHPAFQTVFIKAPVILKLGRGDIDRDGAICIPFQESIPFAAVFCFSPEGFFLLRGVPGEFGKRFRKYDADQMIIVRPGKRPAGVQQEQETKRLVRRIRQKILI